MSRLIDDIRRKGLQPPWFLAEEKLRDWHRHTARLLEILRGPIPVIVADNVSSYYYEASGKENWDLTRDFPNLAPVFPVCFIEHKFPKFIHSDEQGDTPVGSMFPGGRAGVLLIAAKRENARGEGIPENAHWVYATEVFIDYGVIRDQIDGSPGTIFLAIDKDGRLIGAPSMQTFAMNAAKPMMENFMGWLHPALLTISFLHCKNVSTVENKVPPKLAKRYRERHGIAPSNHRTLVIEPLKQILRREGNSDHVGLAKAMHICRGHFKDYREGKGLFGRHHMLVWHDATVRGTRGKEAPAREIEVKL